MLNYVIFVVLIVYVTGDEQPQVDPSGKSKRVLIHFLLIRILRMRDQATWAVGRIC
jgi:hypothetical protein